LTVLGGEMAWVGAVAAAQQIRLPGNGLNLR
jgi:hypothetical protein